MKFSKGRGKRRWEREKKREERKKRGERRKEESEGVRGRLSRRIALLMESWLSVGPRYNLHYIYLPGFVVLPKCRPEGPPPSKHKAVKRFNSIGTAQREEGVDSTNLTPPIVSRFGIPRSLASTLPPYLSVLIRSIVPSSTRHPFRSLSLAVSISFFSPFVRGAAIFSLRSARVSFTIYVIKIIVFAATTRLQKCCRYIFANQANLKQT